jgi:hypothetical protein
LGNDIDLCCDSKNPALRSSVGALPGLVNIISRLLLSARGGRSSSGVEPPELFAFFGLLLMVRSDVVNHTSLLLDELLTVPNGTETGEVFFSKSVSRFGTITALFGLTRRGTSPRLVLVESRDL